MKLTKAVIDKLQYEGKPFGTGSSITWSRHVVWDTTLPGFGIRVVPSGKKFFVVSYRASGRKRLMTIGRFGVFTVDQARDACRDVLNQVTKAQDPLAVRQAGRVAKTFGELCDDFINTYAKAKKRSWIEDERRIKRCIPEGWKNRKADDISNKDVEDLHFSIGQKSGIEANRTLALISKMYNQARLFNPAKGIKKFPEQKRVRWLTQDEILSLKDAINKELNIYVKAGIWLLLLTGLRKSELLKAKWADVNVQQQSLFLKITKSGKPHHAHLSAFALQILKKLPRVHGNPYILPGSKAGHHLVNIYKPWYCIVESSGIKNIRINDMRHTIASMLVQSGESLQLVGKVLNHSNTRTTEIYAHLADSQPKDAVEQHGTKLADLVGEIGF